MWTSLSAPPLPSTSAVLPVSSAPTVLVLGGGNRAAHVGMVLAATDLLVLRTARPGEDGVRRPPDVVLVAVDQPAELNRSLLAARALAVRAKLVVLSEVVDPAVLVTAVRAGVEGWILPGTAAPDTVDRLVRVARGEAGFCHVVTGLLVIALRSTAAAEPPVPAAAAAAAEQPDLLTARERQVHEALQAGRSVPEIAHELSLSEVTVRWHAGRAGKKLQGPTASAAPEPVARTSVAPATRGAKAPARRPTLVATPPVPGRPARQPDLTPAETRVAHLVARGLSNPQVAGQLCISGHTVESHLKQVFGKLGVRSRVGLTRALLTEAG